VLKHLIAGPGHRKVAEVDITTNEKQALIVATRPLKIFNNTSQFLFNETNGIDINKNAAFGGTPIKIHNGIDDVLWTGTGIVGASRWIFNSSAQAHTGTQSIDGTTTKNGDVTQLAKGSDQDLTGHTAITGWIYITSWSVSGTKEVLFFGWNTGTSLMVGNNVNLGDYINTLVFNTWQKFSIPLNDLGLFTKTVDSVRVQTVSLGAGQAPSYYLDDIQIEETGDPITYTVQPKMSTWLHISEILSTFVDGFNNVLLNATMPNLAYNKILALSALSNGIIYHKTIDGNVDFTFVIKQLSDFIQLAGTSIINSGSDGTNTWMTINYKPAIPIILRSNTDDKMLVTISDNLSDLLLYRVSINGYIETRK